MVPKQSLGAQNPATFPVFFNPAARLNRDVSVAIARATRPSTFLDSLAGIGARGIRIANEADRAVDVTLVEFNRQSARIAERNAGKNRVMKRCHVVHEESNAYLHSRYGRLERFEAVDVDPFGTPAPYVQGAISATADEGIVSLTATDTATLCGVYPRVALRRYGARLMKTEFAHEVAVRVLLGFCARAGGTIDIGIRPVAAHCNLHYARVYFRVMRGAARSDDCLKNLGFVSSCPACHQNVAAPRETGSCPGCGKKAKAAGPLWIGDLVGEELVGKAVDCCVGSGWDEARRELEDLRGCDSYPPFGYSLENIASREGVSSVSFQAVAEALARRGSGAMRQPFGSRGLKTTADYSEVVEAVRECAR